MKKILLLPMLLAGIVLTLKGQPPTEQLTPFVDPFIGTEGAGNVFPGASLPFGMVKLGPDCADKSSNSGYVPGAVIHGFSHVHVSGTGGGPKYGNILVMPFTGPFQPEKIQSQPANEQASPGYFAVDLTDYHIKAEMTVSGRVGFHRYTFDDGKERGILIDAGSMLGEHHCCGEAQQLIGSEINIVSDTLIQGYTRVRGGWNKGGEYTVFFSAVFDTPAKSYGTWKGNVASPEKASEYDSSEKTGAWFFFGNGSKKAIQVKVGISFISSGKALANLKQEVPGWDFEKVHQDAAQTWNKVLNTIHVEGASDDMKKVFYTAMYHAMLMPVDRTGENPKWHSDEPYYDDFYAIWDTFRATNPLLTLIQPDRERDIVRSLIDIYRYEGYMPDSRSGNQTGRTQGGSNCDMVVADAFLKGLKGIDYQTGYEAMVNDAEIPPGGNQQTDGRGGINEYIKLNYVPAEYEPKGKSPTLHTPKLYDRAGTRTVEYSANDWAIAQVAKGLGKEADYEKYRKRASNWANLWRSQVTDSGVSGFIWPRRRDGSWVEDFSTTKAGSWGNFFYEADSWEYSFYVPQDARALIDSCGGPETFVKRLDTFFTGPNYRVDNEPSFFTPCLYTYAGYQYKSSDRVRDIIQKHYTSAKDGIPGNDDSGSMSAWLVFNAVGFYPNAGQNVYLITAPHFHRAVLDLGNGKQLEVVASNLSDKNRYIQTATLNGKPLNRAWFRHSEIADGGKLRFVMGPKPSAFGKEHLPPSLSDPE